MRGKDKGLGDVLAVENDFHARESRNSAAWFASSKTAPSSGSLPSITLCACATARVLSKQTGQEWENRISRSGVRKGLLS